jgi:hypothetical protein
MYNQWVCGDVGSCRRKGIPKNVESNQFSSKISEYSGLPGYIFAVHFVV